MFKCVLKKYQKETNEYGFPIESDREKRRRRKKELKSDREKRRRRKKELKEFWSKSLKGYLSEDFWNLLDINEQSSISYEFQIYEGSKEDFVKELKSKFSDRVSDCRELTLTKLGIS